MSIMLSGFIIGLGFVAAAFLYCADYAIRGKPAYLVLSSPNMLHVMGNFVFCMFAGPYVVAERGLEFWRSGRVPFGILIVCGIISLMWSFCSGVFVAQLLTGLGIINA